MIKLNFNNFNNFNKGSQGISAPHPALVALIALATITVLGLAVLVALLLTIISGMESDTDEDLASSTVIMVFGAGLNGDQVSTRLKARLDACLETIETLETHKSIDTHQNTPIPIVVSGGQGPDEAISEALAMERYLVDHGIDPGRIYREDKSTSTQENIQFTHALIKNNWPNTRHQVLLITSDFHMFRARMLAKRQNWTYMSKSAPHNLGDHLRLIPREVLALLKDLIINK